MSHSNGQVKFKDGTVMHFEYDGTSDIVIPKMYLTNEELVANWRNHDYDNMYDCEHKEEEVEITYTYGSGATMTGRACRKCSCITFDYEYYLEHMIDDFCYMVIPNKVEEEDKEKGWVKKGIADWYK